MRGLLLIGRRSYLLSRQLSPLLSLLLSVSSYACTERVTDLDDITYSSSSSSPVSRDAAIILISGTKLVRRLTTHCIIDWVYITRWNVHEIFGNLLHLFCKCPIGVQYLWSHAYTFTLTTTNMPCVCSFRLFNSPSTQSKVNLLTLRRVIASVQLATMVAEDEQ